MIEFKNVSKTYSNGTHALQNVNLTVADGEFVFIVGSSGAGKSTFLKLIMCEETPNEGDIIVNGTHITSLKKREIPYLRRMMGIVFQDFRLLKDRTVYDNIAFAQRVVGKSSRQIKESVPGLLSLVGLSDKAKAFPNELSGGEQQRVALARALANNPPVLLADEPTGNLDPKNAWEIMKLLEEINLRGTTVIVVTHNKDIVEQMQKRVITLSNGVIVSDEQKGGYYED